MSSQINTQLISYSNYSTSNMIFNDPIAGNVPTSGPGAAISYQRIPILTRNDDGSVGELVIQTPKVFSYGVGENISPETGKVNGWSFPLCLPVEEKDWVTTFNAIVESCIDHLLANKDLINKYDLERSDLKKFNPLYYKKEQKMVNGKKVMVNVENFGPTLYTKLIFSKKNEKFVTNFFDENDTPLDPLTLLGKYCHASAAVKIESIFIGNKISLQVKLYEAVVTPVQQGMKRLIAPRPAAESFASPAPPPAMLSRQQTESAATPLSNNRFGTDDDDDDDDDDGSIEDVKQPPTPVLMQTTKPVTKKMPVKK